MKKALKTNNDNYLVKQVNEKNETINVGYFFSNGIFIRWSDDDEYEWARNNWNKEEVQVDFVFPENNICQIDSKNTETIFLYKYLISIGVKPYFEEHVIEYVESKKFVLDKTLISNENQKYEFANLPENILFINLIDYYSFCKEHRNHTESEMLIGKIIIFHIPNKPEEVYTMIEHGSIYRDQYDDNENSIFTIIKGNFFSMLNDIETHTNTYKELKGKEIIKQIN